MIDAHPARNRKWFIAATMRKGLGDQQERSSSKAINSYMLVSAKNG